MIDLNREQFIKRLIEAGWDKAEAESEWDRIQDDDVDESGYDGA